MGGTISLNLLAEAGESRVGTLEQTLVICPPIDLAAVENHFSQVRGKVYDRFFVRLLWHKIVDRWEHIPNLAPQPPARRPKRLREIDEMVIAPASGYTSADDYYEKTSPGPKLESIRQPVTILTSQDDPIVPMQGLEQSQLSDSIEQVSTARGGHLGFIARRNGDPDFRWLDWRIIDWVKR